MFGHLGLVFIWSCFVFCLLFFLVICVPVPAERTEKGTRELKKNGHIAIRGFFIARIITKLNRASFNRVS